MPKKKKEPTAIISRSLLTPEAVLAEKPEKKQLLVSQITIDENVSVRAKIHTPYINKLKRAIDEGVELPPLVVFHDGSQYILADGQHSIEAYKLAGHIEIDALVYPGDAKKAFVFAARVNAKHGLRLSNREKRNLGVRFLRDPELSRWSDREIARWCGVSNTLISNLRKETQTVNGLQCSTRITAKGEIMNIAGLRTKESQSNKDSQSPEEDFEQQRDQQCSGSNNIEQNEVFTPPNMAISENQEEVVFISVNDTPETDRGKQAKVNGDEEVKTEDEPYSGEKANAPGSDIPEGSSHNSILKTDVDAQNNGSIQTTGPSPANDEKEVDRPSNEDSTGPCLEETKSKIETLKAIIKEKDSQIEELIRKVNSFL